MFKKLGTFVLLLVMASTLLPSAASAAGGTVLSLGSRGTEVTSLQKALSAQGSFNYHTFTQYFGSITQSGLKKWEGANGLPIDGKIVVGSSEWSKLVGQQPSPGASNSKTTPPSNCLTYGPSKVLCASKADGRLYAIQNGKVADWATVRFGGKASDGTGPWFTREGVFRVSEKKTSTISTLYNVEMPYWMRFDGGQGFHYSSEFNSGYQYSHGCVGIKYRGMAKWMYDWAPLGTLVVITSA